MKKLLIPLILACYIPIAFAGSITQTQLQFLANQYIALFQKSEHISAISVLVKSPNLSQPLTALAGTISENQNIPIHSNNLYQIGSITKSFISVILLQLENDPAYHFSINDSITKFFPQYPNWHNITVKELMNMTSGIPDYFTNRSIFIEFASYPYQTYQPRNWVDRMYQTPLLFMPGTHFNYSNTNYFILGMLIEKLTGHSLADELNTRIIQPLHLNSTYYVPDPMPSLLIHGYQFQKQVAYYIPLGTDVTDYNLSYLSAAGGVISDNNDVLQWVQALFTPDKVLNSAQLKKLTSLVSEKTGIPIAHLSLNNKIGYGLGINAKYNPKSQRTDYTYQGVTFGYRTVYIYDPVNKIYVSATVNSGYDGKPNHLLTLVNFIINQLS